MPEIETCKAITKMDGADEADFIELLVASEKVTDWVERIRARGNVAR